MPTFSLPAFFIVRRSADMLILHWLQEKIEKYFITSRNIYNFDEKGFLIGLSKTFKRIVFIEHLRNKKILGASLLEVRPYLPRDLAYM
jgi:hypothetical protein